MAKRTNRMAWGLVVGLTAVTLAKLSAALPLAPLPPVGGMRAPELSGIHHDPGVTPLMIAAVMDQAPRVERLLDRGVNVNGRDKKGMTALMWAAPRTSLILLRRGAGVLHRDRFGRTPLHFAAYFGDIPFIKALLKRGAPLEARDNQGRTPLVYAVLGESTNGWRGYAMDERGWLESRDHRDTLVSLLLARQVAMERQGRRWPTSRIEAIQTLLDQGAVDAADNGSMTPLIYAAWLGYGKDDPEVQALLDKGANDGHTRWPSGFDPVKAGAVKVP
jgi:hypothetical protein